MGWERAARKAPSPRGPFASCSWRAHPAGEIRIAVELVYGHDPFTQPRRPTSMTIPPACDMTAIAPAERETHRRAPRRLVASAADIQETPSGILDQPSRA